MCATTTSQGEQVWSLCSFDEEREISAYPHCYYCLHHAEKEASTFLQRFTHEHDPDACCV